MIDLLTSNQREKLRQLEALVGQRLPIRGASRGYAFTEVDGVTILITRVSRNPRGGYKIPAVCTYDEVKNPTNLDAAIRARELFDKQKPVSGKSGHRNSTISPQTWKCGNLSCPCAKEEGDRLWERSLR